MERVEVGYLATVQVFVPYEDTSGTKVETVANAQDFIAETLRGSGFLDWSYTSNGEPKECEYQPETYLEGDIFE